MLRIHPANRVPESLTAFPEAGLRPAPPPPPLPERLWERPRVREKGASVFGARPSQVGPWIAYPTCWFPPILILQIPSSPLERWYGRDTNSARLVGSGVSVKVAEFVAKHQEALELNSSKSTASGSLYKFATRVLRPALIFRQPLAIQIARPWELTT